MRFLASIAPLVVLVTACASNTSATADDPAPVPTRTERTTVTDTVVRVDTVQVASPNQAELELRAARLQLQLLEKETLIGELREALDAERQEVVRNMAKLQSQANRAEAASGMAEAEIALQSLAEAGAEAPDEHRVGSELLARATAEFSRENYGGALYLAAQIRTVVAAGQTRMRGANGQALESGEALFALPVPLVTVSRSNVRAGPGTSHSVEATLEPETAVTGMSYTSEWVRVAFGDGKEGWIFHTLVAKENGRP